MYSLELNSSFENELNPVSIIICANGSRLIAGNWDTDTPIYDLQHEQLHVGNVDFADFVEFSSFNRLHDEAEKLLNQLTKRPFQRPTKLLGGQSVRNEEIGHNSFGAALSLDYRHLFNPLSREERAFIVRNAYIQSKRRERYIEPIDKIIRAAAPPSETDARLIEDTGEPREVIDSLRQRKMIENQVLLLIGGVGSGKSTFVDYLREVALPDDLVETSSWININMNFAPLDKQRIYDWLCDQVTIQLKQIHEDLDFDTLEILEKVYAVELTRFKKGPLKLLESESTEYKKLLAEKLIQLQQDKELTASAFTRYCCAERGKLLIVVMDNCDKRIRDDQLLMFEVAQWFQRQFRCLVILPLRDVTYDNHRSEPPLDTALKDLVFRIEPPAFQRVLSKRITLALTEMSRDQTKQESLLTYQLPSGIRVECAPTEQGYYLVAILRSIFEYDKFVRRMIVGLAGRDIRKAMEIFLEFCNSGHIGEDVIFKIRHEGGKYALPYEVVARILLRMNRRFYSGDHSYIKNIFESRPEDSKPNYFVRLAILRWLERRFKQKGPIGVVGYHPVRKLKADLFLLGLSDEIVQRELLYLLKARCILAEHLRVDQLEDDDLVRLAPAGSVHLELISNLDYLAAVAEETWFDNEAIAQEIADRIGGESHFEIATTLKNAETLIRYLQEKLQEPFPSPDTFLENMSWRYMVDLTEDIQKVEDEIQKFKISNPWFNISERYGVGQVVEGVVTNTREQYGIFVEIEPGVAGLIHKSNMGVGSETVIEGQKVLVEIESIVEDKERMGLIYRKEG